VLQPKQLSGIDISINNINNLKMVTIAKLWKTGPKLDGVRSLCASCVSCAEVGCLENIEIAKRGNIKATQVVYIVYMHKDVVSIKQEGGRPMYAFELFDLLKIGNKIVHRRY
ncbi:hypothetical protein ACJX0J_025413, partial [Zea mays]